MPAKKKPSEGPDMPVDSATLDWANWWYDVSSKGLLAAGLVTAIAAVLTVVFAVRQWQSDSIRVRYSDERTASLERDAEGLRLETETLKLEGEKLKGETAKANVFSAKANQAAAEANERAAELQKQADEARLATERIKDEIAWRRLSPTQFKVIADGLKEANLKITLAKQAGDPEAVGFARDIESALKAAGMSVETTSVLSFNAPATGIRVSGTAQQVILIRDVFLRASIEVTPWKETKDILQIEVGSRPQPFSD